MRFLLIVSFSLFIFKGVLQSKNDTNIKFNDKAVFVNSIAPDRGLADPHVIIVNDTLYCMCGHDKTWNTVDFCHMDRWELWATTDLKKWSHKLNILPTQTYIGNEDNCWAGDLAKKNGMFYWYFSNRNLSTGVMSSPTMCGPWKDALQKPLITPEMAKTKPYDPEIFEENGKHYIIWGANQYYIAELSDDMISLAEKPQPLLVKNEDGSKKYTGDKPCMFKRNGWYYLSWGYCYAMSKNLRGPYTFKGQFIDGGHGSVFNWKGQWYTIQENHETNAFYRGVQLRPLYFNKDNTVYIPEHNYEYPLPGRIYDFKYSTQGWRSEKGTKVERENSPYIHGKVNEKGAIIASTPFLHTPIYLCKEIMISITKMSNAKEMKVAFYSYGDGIRYTREAPQRVDWSKQEWVIVPLSNKKEQTITIPFTKFKKANKFLHQIAIQPIADIEKGAWRVNEVIIK